MTGGLRNGGEVLVCHAKWCAIQRMSIEDLIVFCLFR